MRQEIEDIDLWVDAVCINQADIAEKKAQVALMDRIYKEATSILVWLGGSNLDASLAFNLLKLLADLRAQDDLPDTKAKADSWASVINLTKKSYWRRVWILQELEFSKKAEVAWGSETIKLETMARAWSTILTKRKQVEAILHRAGWDDSSAQYFFNRVTAQIEFQSNPCTIRASWVDQTFERERVTSAAGIQDHDDDFEEATAPEFRCQYCLAEKSTLGQLDRHIRTHTLPYRCDFQGCEIGKATQRDLDRHMDAHLKIRRYFCPVKGCPWHPNGPTGGFSRRLDNAKRHLKSHIDYHDLVDNVDASVVVDRSKPSTINLVRLKESDDSDSGCSVASLESFTPSIIASSATSISDMEPLARDSVVEISYLISNDDQLQKLLEKAFCFIDPEKVTRNFRRILRSFSQDLMREATTLPQKQVAKLVGHKSRQIAVLVRENVLPSKLLILPEQNVDPVREDRLQDYLQEISPQLDSISDVLIAPTRASVIDDDSDVENDDDDPAEHPDLTKLKEWFLSANAMQNFRNDFLLFLSPVEAVTTNQAIEDASPSLTSSPESDRDSGGEVGFTKNATIGTIVKTVQGTKMLGVLSLFQKTSTVWNYINAKQALEPGLVRLNWTCNCGHTSHDDFRELRPGAVAAYAGKLVDSGYVTHAQSTNLGSGSTVTFITAARNKATAVGRNIGNLKFGKQGRNPKPKTRKFANIQCSPTPGVTCRWLHLCLKQRPNAKVIKLESLHICKDDKQKDLTDASFFKVLRRAWKMQRTWTDLILFKLARIEFIEFSAFPDDSVDRIVADKVPPTTDHYDFAPPPPLEMVPPIAAEHMVHLLLSECTPSMQGSSFYLSQLPKKKDKPLKFSALLPPSLEFNTGYGLRFVETPDPSIIVSFLFVMAVVIGTVFGICWTVFQKDMQDA
ncbi:HET-domain-containing protein [Mollisia scopiformis]|uniref:HET-domain-containing protein n=1 Tax=Mollisia scopiformis TaxID=149040 RepID=A0A194WZN3_MOLSC|nr:HET-domain-containing protein [Mollisia scopiformis]KUJ13403.1 HET-domain-containing protein [Mollisia scopiformis]